jgi:uncharacterized repeat protein (TIGR03803 family)
VNFFSGTAKVGSGTLDPDGVATLTTSSLPAGSDALTASYVGDADYAVAKSAATTEQVNKVGVTVALASALNPSQVGRPVTFTATVTPETGVDGTPTGFVVFSDGAGVLGTVPLVNGVATISRSFPHGTYAVTASYLGTRDFAAGTSNTVDQTASVPAYSFTTLGTFNGANGANPNQRLALDAAGNLYGSTINGGAASSGTVFEIPRGRRAVETLASLDIWNDGSVGNGGVVLDGDGNLYSTAGHNGPLSHGTVFEVAKGSNTITVLASFDGDDGDSPAGRIVLDAQGNLFGVTLHGGTYGDGTVFEVAKGSNAITTLASFDGANGMFPDDGIQIDAQGNLFGTTTAGGDHGQGTVYEIAAGSNTITTLASFDGASGSNPSTELVEDAQGDIFGTAASGGAYGDGTVFEVVAGSNTITTIASFDGANGSTPYGTVGFDAFGDLFGAASAGGASNDGTVFEIPAGTSTIVVLHSFSGPDGATPDNGALIDSNGNLYVSTLNGGPNNDGGVYELSPVRQAATVALAADNTAPAFGQPVTFTATVSPPSATGTVTFYDGATVLGTGTLNGSGVATLTTSGLPAGAGTVTAIYGGDQVEVGATSAGLPVTVGSASTTTAVTASANPAEFGHGVTFTASVTSATGAPVGSGFVQFSVDGHALGGPVAVSNGVAVSPSVSSLAIGPHAVTAAYSDASGEFLASTGTLTGESVLDFTSTALSASTSSSAFGQSVTFTATVTNLDTSAAVIGTVDFYDGSILIGHAMVGAGGVATFTTTRLPQGSDQVTASYRGNTVFAASASPALAVLVGPADTSGRSRSTVS